MNSITTSEAEAALLSPVKKRVHYEDTKSIMLKPTVWQYGADLMMHDCMQPVCAHSQCMGSSGVTKMMVFLHCNPLQQETCMDDEAMCLLNQARRAPLSGPAGRGP